ncbi:DivIVA domain-containing protein [Lactobacillus psittaci]|nr:DivIVA domain-containing protein [Lactobacillus psittaci]
MAEQKSQDKKTLTPMDIHNQEFKKRGHNGYDRYEVDSFLDKIIDSYGDCLDHNVDLKNENVQLKQEVAELKAKIQEFDKIKNSVNSSLISAQETADEIKAKAKADAESIINDARQKAEEKAADLHYQNQTLASDYLRLKKQVKEFRDQTKSLIQKELESLDDDSWQYYLDQYYHTNRMYPADGGEPIDPNNSPLVDNGDANDVNLEQETSNQEPAQLTGDSPKAETIDTDQRNQLEQPKDGDVTIVFPEDYKDHK